MKRALTDQENDRVAEAIVSHLEGHNWKIWLGGPGRPPG
jgi:hypothetical protein